MKSDELRAALGSSQIDKIEKFWADRWNNFQYLLSGLWVFDELHIFSNISSSNFLSSPFGFPITVTTNEFTRKELVDYLETNGVHTRPVFAGNITRQPMFDNVKYEIFGDLSGSDYVMERTFWIGCWPGLSQAQLDYIISVFDEFFKVMK